MNSIKNVLHLYENNKNDNQKAYIQYNIWKYKNDKTAKQNAIELYSKLFKESPKNHYKSLIKELS